MCLSRNNSKNLSKKDLPRRVRSPRQLSHCNEQIFKFSQSELKLPVKSQQQKVHQPHQQLTLIKRDSQRSLIMESPQASSNNNSNNKNNNNNAKAVSCEAISVPHQIESKPASKTQKSAKVSTLKSQYSKQVYQTLFRAIFDLSKKIAFLILLRMLLYM